MELVSTFTLRAASMEREFKLIWEPKTMELLCQMHTKMMLLTDLLEPFLDLLVKDAWPCQSVYLLESPSNGFQSSLRELNLYLSVLVLKTRISVP
jgi:hypothetical protein